MLIESMPVNLDPRVGTDSQSQHLDGLIFSSLVAHDSRMNLVPDLAERWDTPDARTYIFHLRPGVRFHDGRALTSADVKYTLDSILSGEIPTPKRGSFRLVESVAAPDPATVVIHLREPYASFLWDLARPAIGIVPAGAGDSPSSHPVGTGPFRFVSARADEDVLLERNPDYFGVAAKIPRLRFRVVPDAMVRALELRKGSADLVLSALSPDTVLALARDPNIEVADDPGTILAYISFNCEDPILRRRPVRQALAYATDRSSLIRYLLRGEARIANSLLPPDHWAFEGNVPQYPYDPGRAEQLLDAAGFARPAGGIRFSLTLKTSTDESARLLGAALQQEWSRVGVGLELRSLEPATLLSDLSRGSFQLYTLRWVGANNDPDIFDFVFNSAKIPPAGANRGHYRNPALDALLDRARVEMDREKRRALYSEVQKIVAVDLPYLDLWYTDNVAVFRRRVGNVHVSPAGDFDFLVEVELK